MSDRLPDLRALLRAAPSGRPWTHRPNHKPYHIVVFGGAKAYMAGLTTSDIDAHDAALIVAAVNALPALLDVVDAARDVERLGNQQGMDDDEWEDAMAVLGAALERLDGAS